MNRKNNNAAAAEAPDEDLFQKAKKMFRSALCSYYSKKTNKRGVTNERRQVDCCSFASFKRLKVAR